MLTEVNTVYFSKPGAENTGEVLRIAKLRAEELNIKSILVASNTGDTAARATEVFDGIKVIAVGQNIGHNGPNIQGFTDENRRKVESRGGAVLNTTHALTGGINRAMQKKLNMYPHGYTIANTLRIFGQGTKVACEICLMAADGGLVRTDEDVISIAGTGSGADTALVFRPVNSVDFFELRVKEILCKPHF